MMPNVSQSAFIQAAMNPDLETPHGIVGPDGLPAPKRFSVYRNNIIVSLKEAMNDGFPAVASLVGEAFFTAMSDIYIRQNPPKSPILALYGASFPEFIAEFEPAASLPYLKDVAGLEYALRHAYHCADATPVDPQAFANANIFSATLSFAPSVSALRSDYPVTQIRTAALGGPQPTGGAEDILITRPDLDPIATAFPSGTATIIDALHAKLPFGEAIEAGPEGLDLPAFIGTLISGGAITKLEYDNV
ncbi:MULTISPECIES: HvfC/BufC N-terminal domain-containing protein [Pacificibacter]|uniref:HvfC/BufC N-terminal domain-containing protein n=1 Tax=Pacificibacter TaxID=1042323 RepID=UPI001C0A373D|nr:MULTISPECIES: DNA-binding domain-containing protein [Pacificibacter]MBU2935845.1 DNA-binding domain-containing protein [Pacificibacter marinus]MDO6614340.1 DNA-binding domain-containing protein [Pacificibacter sp. 1_MG-2023]